MDFFNEIEIPLEIWGRYRNEENAINMHMSEIKT